jgi:hypothetical protein
VFHQSHRESKTLKKKSTVRFVLAALLSLEGVAAAQPAPAPSAVPASPSDPASPAAAPTATATAPAPAPAPVLVLPPPASDDDDTMTFHARPADMQQFAAGSLQELHVGRARTRYALNLFGDAGFGVSSRREGSNPPDPAFVTGVFDMLFNAELHETILATSEVTFAYDPAAPVAALERLHVRWKPSKNFFIEVGRFHTDIGYWNVAYHHGKWLQLPIERPRQIALHGGLLPTHMIGAQAGLSLPVAHGSINLVGSVGSARDPAGNPATHGGGNHSTTVTPVNAVHAKLSADDILGKDTHFGVSGVYSRIPADGPATRPILPDLAFDEYVGNAFIAHVGMPFTFIAEGYHILHQIPRGDVVGASGGGASLAGGKWRTWGAFALAGYTVGVVTPYVKGEYITTSTNAVVGDPFYNPERNPAHAPTYALDLLEGTVGTRIDVSTWSALKFEYRITTGQATSFPAPSYPTIHTAAASWSFGI